MHKLIVKNYIHGINIGNELKRSSVIEKLFHENWATLCGKLRKQFRYTSSDAEDIAQSAFVKINEVEDINHIKHPRAFLFKTAHNIALNRRDRMLTASRFVDEALREVNQSCLEQNTPETVFSVKQSLTELQKAMLNLTNKQREIIVRNRIHGESYSKISVATGWSKADISRQLNKALETIQNELHVQEQNKINN
ncbi:MAG: sigma-70 family RNA polymerase sigma factor [Emcibacteraceae bacterium]|nr:sigma-70 family RNA polymerase sigma factor [Emcibacteraceae bacterium]